MYHHHVPTLLEWLPSPGATPGYLSTRPSSLEAYKPRSPSKGPLYCSGMTVEVLGTVLGTAIQGQIVGQADTPCLQDPSDSALAMEGANHTQSTTSLKETVRPLVVWGFGEMRHRGMVCHHPQPRKCLFNVGQLIYKLLIHPLSR